MPKNDTIELTLPGIILDFGKHIADSAGPRRVVGGSPGRQADPEQVAAAEERLLSKAKADATACRLIGIPHLTKANDPEQTIRLRIFAFLAHKFLREQSRSPVDVAEVAAAAMDHRQPPGEAVLRARHIVGQMAASDALIASGGNEDDGLAILDKVRLASAALEWLAGGRNSMGVMTVPKLLGMSTGLQSDAETAEKAEKSEKGQSGMPRRLPTARQLYQRIRTRIIGLDSQVETIACRLVMHMTRAKMIRDGKDPETPNESWLVIGPPSVGKTFMLEVALEAAGELSGGFIPFATADGSDLSADGYVGLAFNDTLRHLLAAAKWDADKARYGFLAIDEFTKKARSLGESAVTTVIVQQEALRVISGQAMTVGGRRGRDRPVSMTTVGTGFALMGHCPGLDRMIEKRMGRHSLGFSMGEVDRRARSWLIDSLMDFGLIEELLSRQTAFLVVTPPSVETLVSAIQFDGGILSAYNRLLARHDATIVLEPSGVRALAEHGLENGYFRAMKRVISALASEVLFEERKGDVWIVDADVRRAIEKAEGETAAAASLAPRAVATQQEVASMDGISGGAFVE